MRRGAVRDSRGGGRAFAAADGGGDAAAAFRAYALECFSRADEEEFPSHPSSPPPCDRAYHADASATSPAEGLARDARALRALLETAKALGGAANAATTTRLWERLRGVVAAEATGAAARDAGDTRSGDARANAARGGGGGGDGGGDGGDAHGDVSPRRRAPSRIEALHAELDELRPILVRAQHAALCDPTSVVRVNRPQPTTRLTPQRKLTRYPPGW